MTLRTARTLGNCIHIAAPLIVLALAANLTAAMVADMLSTEPRAYRWASDMPVVKLTTEEHGR